MPKFVISFFSSKLLIAFSVSNAVQSPPKRAGGFDSIHFLFFCFFQCFPFSFLFRSNCSFFCANSLPCKFTHVFLQFLFNWIFPCGFVFPVHSLTITVFQLKKSQRKNTFWTKLLYYLLWPTVYITIKTTKPQKLLLAGQLRWFAEVFFSKNFFKIYTSTLMILHFMISINLSRIIFCQ